MSRASESLRHYLNIHPRLHSVAKPIIRLVRVVLPPPGHRQTRSFEHLFRNVVGGSLAVRLGDLGVFEIGSRSNILSRVLIYGEYEPRVMAVLRSRVDPNKDVIDVGANIGILTVLLAGLISNQRKVLAIEPTPGALTFLRRNVASNGATEKVILFEGVAEESSREFAIKVFHGMEEFSTLMGIAHSTVKGQKFEELRVAGETIDSLVQRHNLSPGLIKIDTEGAELHVLRGAKETIRRFRPTIVCEEFSNQMTLEAGEAPGGIRALLKDYGYSFSLFEAEELLAVPAESGR
jgi:FkbM family methyltransferase